MAVESAIPALVEAAPERRRLLPRWVRSLLRARLAAVGVVILAVVVVGAVFAPLLAPHNPRTGDLINSKLPPFWMPEGTRSFPLGTDTLGRDILSRVIYGARISLAVGFTAVAIAGVLGISIGLTSGYYKGRIDDVIMRLAEIQLAVPFILFAIAVLAVLGPGLKNLILVLGITGWVTYARVVRGQVLSFREKEFVEAARCLGASDPRVMLRSILPNTLSPLVVQFSLGVGYAMLVEAGLSFLGLGVQPPTAAWGQMVGLARNFITITPWLITFPGLAIFLAVLAFNFLGDGLREVMDPRLRRHDG
jgi:peptide/nickel transport system permease protein